MYVTAKPSYSRKTFTHKDRVPLRTVPTQEALAYACAAQRINGSYVKDTRRFSEQENKTQFSLSLIHISEPTRPY